MSEVHIPDTARLAVATELRRLAAAEDDRRAAAVDEAIHYDAALMEARFGATGSAPAGYASATTRAWERAVVLADIRDRLTARADELDPSGGAA